MLKHGDSSEGRYDSATTDKIIRLASRLDAENRERLSAEEIEGIAKEIGIESAFVREALQQVVRDKVGRRLDRVKEDKPPSHSHAAFWSTFGAFLIPLVWASIAFFVSNGDLTTGKFFTLMAPLPLALIIGFIAGNRKVGFVASLVLVLALWPALDRVLTRETQAVFRNTGTNVVLGEIPDIPDIPNFAGLEGLARNAQLIDALEEAEASLREVETELAKSGLKQEDYQRLEVERLRREAKVAGARKRLDEATSKAEAKSETGTVAPTPPLPVTPGSSNVRVVRREPSTDLPKYLVFGSLLAGILGAIGGGIRQRHFPFDKPHAPNQLSEDRQKLLDQYVAIQQKLHGQKRPLTFLSVDVSDSTGMKRGQEDLVVEHSFTRYTTWIGEIALRYGGQVQSTAGDGVMCAFSDETAALAAAKAIQEELATFNSERNRLSVPFRLKLGLSKGEVAWDPATPIGLLQSPVIDRAASMQKRATPGTIVVSPELIEAANQTLGEGSYVLGTEDCDC